MQSSFQDRLSERWRTVWQFFVFGLIGGSGVIVDTAVVVLCREAWGIDVRLAAIPAFVVAVSWNYELNRRITFQKEVKETEVNRRRSYIIFVLVCLIGLIVRIGAMHVMIEYMGMRDEKTLFFSFLRLSYIANFVGIFIASVFNFVGSKYVAFR